MADDEAQPTGPDPDWDPGAALAELTRVYLDVVERVERHLQRKARGVSVEDARQHIAKNLWVLWTADIPGWVPPTHTQAFAEQMVRNYLLTKGLKRARWDRVIDVDSDLDELEVCGGLEPDEALRARELQEELDRALDTLSAKLRAAWELWRAGATNDEIALELALTSKTAYNRVNVANRLLRERIKPDQEEG